MGCIAGNGKWQKDLPSNSDDSLDDYYDAHLEEAEADAQLEDFQAPPVDNRKAA